MHLLAEVEASKQGLGEPPGAPTGSFPGTGTSRLWVAAPDNSSCTTPCLPTPLLCLPLRNTREELYMVLLTQGSRLLGFQVPVVSEEPGCYLIFPFLHLVLHNTHLISDCSDIFQKCQCYLGELLVFRDACFCLLMSQHNRVMLGGTAGV